MIVQVVGEEAEKSCPGLMLVVLVKKLLVNFQMKGKCSFIGD